MDFKDALSIILMFLMFMYNCRRQKNHVNYSKLVVAAVTAIYATCSIFEVLYGGDLLKK